MVSNDVLSENLGAYVGIAGKKIGEMNQKSYERQNSLDPGHPVH
jgi:hypothetical protein